MNNEKFRTDAYFWSARNNGFTCNMSHIVRDSENVFQEFCDLAFKKILYRPIIENVITSE